jgi:exosortase/archaeosortase family protein
MGKHHAPDARRARPQHAAGRRARAQHAAPARARRTHRAPQHGRPQRLVTRAVALGLVLTGAVLILGAHIGQRLEAWGQAHVVGLLGVTTQWVDTRVFFPDKGRIAGINVTAGCSVGPVLGVFLICAGAVCAFRPFPARRVTLAAVQLVAVFALANQLRLVAIVLSMRHWGFQRGYDFSHVFLGSVITTVGFVVGAALFVRLLLLRRSQAGA